MSRSLGEALAAASARLAAAGVPDAPRDARALVAHATGVPAAEIGIRRADRLDAAAEARLGAALDARAARQPVAQIIGQRAFWQHVFEVTGDVLDPRPETETLVAAALEGPPAARLLDLGTGSGCIVLSLLAAWPEATAVATDQSAAALKVAARNAERMGVRRRLTLLRGNWLKPVCGRFNLVISNPPYIPEHQVTALSVDVQRWEPRDALTPGGDGLEAYRRIARDLWSVAQADTRAMFEFGEGQGRDVAEIFAAYGWIGETCADLDGRPRVLDLRRR